MGTPQFAVPSLEALVGEHEIVCVITQPDRRAGRGRKLTPPPVKEAALRHGLSVWQPPTLREPQAIAHLKELAPQVMVVVAYGEILRPEVLSIPPHGVINVHASLLPRYRGPSPIAAAILAGDTETGVTVMLMDEGMDTGPILSQATCPIAPDDTAGTLGERLALLGANLLANTLPRWLRGEITPRPQDHQQATYCRLLRKEDGLIDWSRPAEELARQVRAYHPWPGSYTLWRGRPLKVLRARALSDHSTDEPPGLVVMLPRGPAVVTGKGLLLLEEVQPAGRRPMPGAAFARGQRNFVGAILPEAGS